MKVSSRPWSLPTLSLSAAALFFAACSPASSPSTGTGGTGGSATGTGGTSSTGGVNGTGGSSSTGGTPGTGGTSSTGGVTGTGGVMATGGSHGGAGGTSSTGTGGSVGAGGHAGAAAGGHAGSTSTGTGGAGGTSSTGGGGSGCPSNATFCSGFETSGLPTGAIYMVNAAPGDWSRDFGIDTSQHHAGSSSLLVKNQSASGSSGSAYRMLAVPGTAGAFWVRFWIESDMPIGMTEHNAFAGGSIGSGPNDMMIEFAEDVGIAFNTSDQDVWPTGYGRLSNGSTMPYSIPAMTWACVEISYDGTGKHQQLFINGTQLIDATGYPTSALNLTYFKFGFDAYHGPARQVWFDDVAVAPARIGGCN